VLATVSVLSLIHGTLLGTATLRFFPEYEKQSKLGIFRNTLIKATIACVTGIAIVFFGVLQIAKPAISANLYFLMSMGIWLFIATSVFNILLHLLNIREKATAYSCFTIWHTGAGLLFGVAIVLLARRGVEGLLWGSIGALIIAIPVLSRIAFAGIPAGKGVFSKSIAIEMTKYSAPLIIANLAAWILSLSDRYIIGLYGESYEVGLYSASYALSERALTMLWTLFMLAGYPLLVNVWENQGREATQRVAGGLTRYYLLLALPAAVGLSVLSKPIIGMFTAPAYHEAYRIVPLIAFSALLLALQWWPQVGLSLRKKTSISAYCVVGAGLLNIGLNFLLIPRYGYMAAAVTTFISYAFLLVLMVLASRRLFTWEFPFKSMGKIAFASAIMGVVVYLVGNNLTSSTLVNLIVGICLGLVVYGGMLLLLKEVHWSEMWEMVKPKGHDETE
jgi:O-antigen/teichoic acid export membrane protein